MTDIVGQWLEVSLGVGIGCLFFSLIVFSEIHDEYKHDDRKRARTYLKAIGVLGLATVLGPITIALGVLALVVGGIYGLYRIVRMAL